jgi:hypothetical protein
MYFKEELQCAGNIDEVWGRASNLDVFTEYWYGTKSLDYRPDGQGGFEAKMVFAFGGTGAATIQVDHHNRVLTINYVEGPFRGTQKIWVSQGMVGSSWDIEFKGVYSLFGGWIRNHFRQGTVNALRRLCGQVNSEQSTR